MISGHMEGKIDKDELAHWVFLFGNSGQKKRACIIISWKHCNNFKMWHAKTITAHNHLLQLYERVFFLWFFATIHSKLTYCSSLAAQYYLIVYGIW
jgi:hypothetical protein